jgi:hypothetical protein
MRAAEAVPALHMTLIILENKICREYKNYVSLDFANRSTAGLYC